ncbi:MAG: dihydrofolate reductase [Pseudomonadota bacterium]
MIVSLIVAVSDNGVIGKDNALPWRLPADLKYFKRVTMGKPIVMGRKTWESIGKPLPCRRNIVVTRNVDFAADGAEVVNSLEAALASLNEMTEVMIIGGAQIYAAAMTHVDRVYLTRVHVDIEAGDAFFPTLDESQWFAVSEQFVRGADGAPDCTFCVFEPRL